MPSKIITKPHGLVKQDIVYSELNLNGNISVDFYKVMQVSLKAVAVILLKSVVIKDTNDHCKGLIVPLQNCITSNQKPKFCRSYDHNTVHGCEQWQGNLVKWNGNAIPVFW